MRLLTLCLTSCLTLLTFFANPALAANRPSIAVMPFSVDRQVVIAAGNTLYTGTIEDQTALLTDELVHALVASRKFDVLERQRIDDLLQEKDFLQGDNIAPGEAAKVAQLLGADYFVMGRIDSLSASSETKSVPYSSQTYQQQRADISLYLRIVDARSGRIVAAEKFDSDVKVRVEKDKKTQNAGRQLLAQAAQEMVGRITNTVFPLKVARVDGQTLYLNRGADGGLKAGDKVMVYHQGEQIVDRDNGELLGNTETELGLATVVVVEARFTKITLDEKGSAREGMLVRKVSDAAASKAAAPELPAGPRW